MGFIGRFVLGKVAETAIMSGSAMQAVDKVGHMMENVEGLPSSEKVLRERILPNCILISQAPEWNSGGTTWKNKEGVSHIARDLEKHARYKVLSDGFLSDIIDYTIVDAKGSKVASMRRRHKKRAYFTERDVQECSVSMKDTEILSVRTYREKEYGNDHWNIEIKASDYEVRHDDKQITFDVFLSRKKLFQREQRIARITKVKSVAADGYKGRCILEFKDFKYELFGVLFAVAVLET